MQKDTDVGITHVKQQKEIAKRATLECTIEQDQRAIRDRWASTLIHVGREDEPAHKAHLRATQIMMVAMAAIAQGQFEVSISGENDAFGPPSNALGVADYLSHASRVMIDLSELSDGHRDEFLKQFPKKELDARPSTHRTLRQDGILTEEKTLGHGVRGSFLNAMDAVGTTTGIGPLAAKVGIQGPPLTDYGVDIQMGGIGQPNLSGGVSERGRDGHVLIYLGDPKAVMIGLEQTKALGSQGMQNYFGQAGEATAGLINGAWNLVTGKTSPPASPNTKSPSPGLTHDDDNTCGLSGEHSILGHSDDYTAAGSLYFSNVLYKIKLLEQTGALTPAKYNGMRVQLNDGNFGAFTRYFQALSLARRSSNIDEIKQLLKQLPRTALRDLPDESARNNRLFLVKSITPSDLDACFNQLNDVYDDKVNLDLAKGLFVQKLDDIQAWLAEPRRLPNNRRVLSAFRDGEIRSVNPLVKQLENTLNQAVMQLNQNATAELMQKYHQPTGAIQQMLVLEGAYGAIQLNEGCPIYQRFKAQREEIKALYGAIGAASVSEVPAFPFGFLISLEQLETKVTHTVGTNESVGLMHFKCQADHWRELYEAALRQHALQGVEVVEESLIEGPVVARSASAVENDQRDQECRQETIQVPNEEPIWDWVFVWQCMSSPTALNTYGTVLVIAGLIIAGAVATSAIPVVLGATVAVSGFALGAACFFNARSNHPALGGHEAGNPVSLQNV